MGAARKVLYPLHIPPNCLAGAVATVRWAPRAEENPNLTIELLFVLLGSIPSRLRISDTKPSMVICSPGVAMLTLTGTQWMS